MSKLIINPSTLKGELPLFRSKSYTHRALIAAALSKNKDIIINNSNISNDTYETINVFKELNVIFDIKDDYIKVDSRNILLDGTYQDKTFIINESATTLRLLLPILCILCTNFKLILGERLLKRGFNEYDNIFNDNNITYQIIGNEVSFNSINHFTKSVFNIKSDISSQYVSGMILALTLINRMVEVNVPDNSVSKNYIDMSIDILKQANIKYSYAREYLSTYPDSSYSLKNINIPADYSINSYFTIYNKVGSNIVYDKNVLFDFKDNVLKKVMDGKEVIDLSNYPDIAPLLICVSSLFNGCSFTNISRLSTKESNRVEAIKYILDSFKISYELNDDFIKVNKSQLVKPNFEFDSFNDHRICLTEILLLSITGGIINNIDCLNKSSYKYIDTFIKLGLDCEVM